jgi:hypothetical protein
MTAWIFADAGSTTLAAAITTTPTPGTTETWSLTSTTGSPPLPQPTSGQRYGVTVLPPGGDTNPEIVVVTEVLNGTQVVVLRGMGTNGVVKTHSIGDTFSNTIPAGFLNGAAQALVVTQQAGATYTFALADEGTVVESTYATGATFTIPLNSTVAFGVPTEITALDGPGSGVLTVTGPAGVTLNGVSGGSVATTGAYQAITLIQTAANVWVGTTGSASGLSNPVTVAEGGTGATTAAGAATNLSLTPVFNVMFYGAVGNGSTSDTAAIQAAITAAGVGGTVEFPAGHTFIADSLTPLTGQLWQVDGTLKRSTASTVSIITGTSVAGWCLQGNGTIDGNGANTNNQTTGLVYLIQPLLCRVKDLTLQNAPSTTSMLTLRGAVKCKVTGNDFLNNGYHVCLGQDIADTTFQTLRNIIDGNTFDTSALDSVFLTENFGSVGGSVTGNVIGNRVTNNTIIATGDQCIEVGSGCVDTTVTNNTCIGSASSNGGVLLRDAVTTLVGQNTFKGFTKPNGSGGNIAIEVLNLNGTSSDITIEGNKAVNPGYGIVATATGTVGLSISNNTVVGTFIGAGIVVAYATNLGIANNTLAACQNTAVQLGLYGVVSSGVVDATVSDNRAYNDVTQNAIGLFENCTRVLLTGNRCYDSQGSQTQWLALNIQDAAATDITVEDNDFTLWGGNTSPVSCNSGATRVVFRNNKGYNPVGASVPLTAWSIPGSTTVWTNNTGVDGTLYVTAVGAVTAVHVNGVAVQTSLLVGQTFKIKALGTFQLTYSSAPTLVFVGD